MSERMMTLLNPVMSAWLGHPTLGETRLNALEGLYFELQTQRLRLPSKIILHLKALEELAQHEKTLLAKRQSYFLLTQLRAKAQT